MLKYINFLLMVGVVVKIYLMLGDRSNRKTLIDGVPVELTIRMPVADFILKKLFCDLLRSAAPFWNPRYGDVVFILDEEDRKMDFPRQMNSLGLPYTFRFPYEEMPRDIEAFVKLRCRYGRTFGYQRMLYSTFLMDVTTDDTSLIAFVDTDIIFTMPVTPHSVMRNGRPVVKGLNTFWIEWVANWNHSTFLSLGLPMVTDFMNFYPVYIFPSTLRNCRRFMMKRYGVRTFEEAFLKFSTAMVSPISIIMSYAYYYEKERYEWHLDIGRETLEEYNSKRVPVNQPLLQTDIAPELHVSIHEKYYKRARTIHPLEQGLCYTKMHLGIPVEPHCKKFSNEPNLQLFEFQDQMNHRGTWCRGKEKMDVCVDMIEERYRMFGEMYEKEGSVLDVSSAKAIETFAEHDLHMKCPNVTY